MKLRKLAAVSAMTIAAMGLAAGTSYAEPAPAPSASEDLNVGIAPGINYKAFNNGTAAVISTKRSSSMATIDISVTMRPRSSGMKRRLSSRT